MKKLLLTLSALAVHHLIQACPTNCDPDILKKFDAKWNGKHDTKLLMTLKKAEYLYVVKTTAGVLDHSLYCTASVFYKDNTAQNFDILQNGTQLLYKKYTMENWDHQLYTAEKKGHRYYLPYSTEDGVAAFFTCDENGTGNHHYVTIVVFSNRYNKTKVEEAQHVFHSWGIKVTESYPDTCNFKIY